MCADHIAAMNDCFCTGSLSHGNSSYQWFRAIMAVGDDADFQFSLPYLEVESSAQLAAQLSIYITSTLGAIDHFSVYNYIGWCNIPRLGGR